MIRGILRKQIQIRTVNTAGGSRISFWGALNGGKFWEMTFLPLKIIFAGKNNNFYGKIDNLDFEGFSPKAPPVDTSVSTGGLLLHIIIRISNIIITHISNNCYIIKRGSVALV